MNDLQQIEKHNADAVARAATKAVVAGKFVVLKYSGLNFIDYEAFDAEGPRNEAATKWTNESPGNRTELRQPETNHQEN